MIHTCLAKQPCSIRWGPGPAPPRPDWSWRGVVVASLEEGKAQALSGGVPPQVIGQNEGDHLPPDLTHSLEGGSLVWLDVAPGLEGVMGGSVTEHASRGK